MQNVSLKFYLSFSKTSEEITRQFTTQLPIKAEVLTKKNDKTLNQGDTAAHSVSELIRTS